MKMAEWKVKRLCKKTERYCELYGKSVVTKAICEAIGLEDRIEVISLDQILKTKSHTHQHDHKHDDHEHDLNNIEEYHIHDHHHVDHHHFKGGKKSHKIRRQANKKTVIYTIENN